MIFLRKIAPASEAPASEAAPQVVTTATDGTLAFANNSLNQSIFDNGANGNCNLVLPSEATSVIGQECAVSIASVIDDLTITASGGGLILYGYGAIPHFSVSPVTATNIAAATAVFKKIAANTWGIKSASGQWAEI